MDLPLTELSKMSVYLFPVSPDADLALVRFPDGTAFLSTPIPLSGEKWMTVYVDRRGVTLEIEGRDGIEEVWFRPEEEKDTSVLVASLLLPAALSPEAFRVLGFSSLSLTEGY